MRLPSLPTLTALLNGVSQIFLQRHRGCGLLVLLAIALGAPSLLAGGLLGGLAAIGVARCCGYVDDDIAAGLYSYNGILLGLLMPAWFGWTAWTPLLVASTAGLSTPLVGCWMQRMRSHQWLPAFTTPFVLSSWLLAYWLAPLSAPTAALSSGLDGIGLLSATLSGLGQVVFLPGPLPGLCVALGLLLADRRAACWAILGSALGLLLALHQYGSSPQAALGLYGYNAVLAAIALSQTYRKPWAPLLGASLAVLLQPGFAAVGLPALTMPFILACWLVKASHTLLVHAAAQCAPGAAQAHKRLRPCGKTS
ncbi:urea transporter [Pseudomonas borbori]